MDNRVRNWIIVSICMFAVLVVGFAALYRPTPVVVASAVTPTAYGENGKCYYAQYQEEVDKLKTEGKCPVTWVAARAPDPWLYTYWWWYSSPYYYGMFVPGMYHSSYISYTNTTYTNNRSAIDNASSKATYRDTSGKIINGSEAAKKANFTSSGGARSESPSQGNARTNSSASQPSSSGQGSSSVSQPKPASQPAQPASQPASGNARPAVAVEQPKPAAPAPAAARPAPPAPPPPAPAARSAPAPAPASAPSGGGARSGR